MKAVGWRYSKAVVATAEIAITAVVADVARTSSCSIFASRSSCH